MALDQHNENIATMAASLGALLRYNLRNTSHTVALKEEINFCKVYLQIQQFRFEGRFTHEFNIPDWALSLAIVKFSLQPLVENCLIHSSQASGKPICIRISAKQTDDQQFLVSISDTGAGISPDVLIQIHKDLDEKDISSGGNKIWELSMCIGELSTCLVNSTDLLSTVHQMKAHR